MKRPYLLSIVLLFSILSYSQGVATFTVSRSTNITYNSISTSGSSITNWRAGSNEGDNRSFPIAIGFAFSYLGSEYTTLSVSLNGFVDFSDNPAAGYNEYPYGYNNDYFSVPSPNGTLLALAPYYEDLMCSIGTGLGASIKYLTTGTAGNRVFTVEWINMVHQVPPYDQQVNFQVKLYESNGNIEFVYGSMNASGISLGYTCGINTADLESPPTAAQLLTQQTPNTTSFSNNPENSLTTVPVSNSQLTFNGCILPSAAGIISGASTICGGTNGVIYSVPSIANATTYNWILPSGFSIASGSGTNVITVNIANGASSGNIMVNGSNSCGDGTTSTLPVTVNLRPVPTISGPTSACEATSGHAYTTQTGMSNYQWSVSSGGVIESTGTSNSILVSWNQDGAQSVSVNYTNNEGCDASTPAFYPVSIQPRPTPTISGPDSVCLNTPSNTYTTENSMTNYQWDLSSGGTVTAGGGVGDDFITITWNTVGNRWVSVNYSNVDGCVATTPTLFPVTVNPLALPVVYGPNTACQYATGNVYTTQTGMQNYLWSVSPGGTITSGVTDTNQIVVTWNNIGNQFVAIDYQTSAGCPSLNPDTLEVTIHSRPTPTISGPASACKGTGGHTYTTETGMSNYQWSIPSGGTIISGTGTNIVTVAWTDAGTREISVNYANSNGCSASLPTTYQVTVYPEPIPSISGPTPVCQGTGGNTYTTESGMTSYIWNISAGNTITGGGSSGDNFVVVTWNEMGNQSVVVNYTNPNGCIAQTATTFPVLVHPVPQPTISGPDTLCINTSGHVYTTESGMTGYTWTISSGGTITAGTGTNSITVSWNDSGNQTVSVNYFNVNGCTANLPTVFNVSVEPLPVPVITGPGDACLNTSGNTYYTESGMTNYQWTASTGGTITSGGTSSSDSVVITWDSLGDQSVGVGYTSAIGCMSATPTVYDITVHELPVPTITGPTTACLNAGNATYSTETGMSGYVWGVSGGGMLMGGAGTSQITVSWVGAGSQWVDVNYVNGNGCMAATPTNYPVTVDPEPGPAGPITGSDTVCGATSGVQYSVNPISSANAYIWTIPAGTSIASGAGTNTITIDYPETASGGIITVMGSNSCGNGATSPNYPVTFTPTPEPPVISLIGDLLTSTAAEGNQWFLNGIPIAGATGQTWLAEEDGEYWTQLFLNNCAFDTSNHIDVVVTGTPDGHNAPWHLRIYPNPSDGSFTIEWNQQNTPNSSPDNPGITSSGNNIISSPDAGKVSLQVVNQLGMVVWEQILVSDNKTGFSKQTIDLRPIPGGIYSLIFSNKDYRVVKRIVVQDK
jgi:hypothetical protein